MRNLLATIILCFSATTAHASIINWACEGCGNFNSLAGRYDAAKWAHNFMWSGAIDNTGLVRNSLGYTLSAPYFGTNVLYAPYFKITNSMGQTAFVTFQVNIADSAAISLGIPTEITMTVIVNGQQLHMKVVVIKGEVYVLTGESQSMSYAGDGYVQETFIAGALTIRYAAPVYDIEYTTSSGTPVVGVEELPPPTPPSPAPNPQPVDPPPDPCANNGCDNTMLE